MQCFQNWELIIVDDGSTDKSLEIARSFQDPRIRIVAHEKNQNLPTSLNEAVGLARGRYLARMDQDDIAYPERFAVQLAYLESHPEIDLLGSGIVVFSDNGSCQGRLPVFEGHEEICRKPWNGFYLPHPSWMGKTDWFKKNPYRPEAAKAEDQDLLLRSYRHSCFACLPEILLGYRQDNRTFSKLFAARKAFAASSVREALARRLYIVVFFIAIQFLLKATADFFNVHLGFKGLRNKMDLLDSSALSRWQKVWQDVHAPATVGIEGAG
jgi:glycosyltransferase involved in cell wall biosynthesis